MGEIRLEKRMRRNFNIDKQVARYPPAPTAPTMTRVLASLAERGLIVRSPDPSDARSVLVTLSPVGGQALVRIRSERTALLGARLARLTPEQRHALGVALPALEALVEGD